MRTSSGFTLIELLVALLIIGIVVTAATLSIGNNDAELEESARRLQAVLDLAADEAVLQSRDLGFSVTAEGYRFLVRGDEGWRTVNGDPLLRERFLPEELRLELTVEGLPVAPSVDEEEQPTPQVLLFSSGERTPFEATLRPARTPSPAWRVTGEPVGRISLEPVR